MTKVEREFGVLKFFDPFKGIGFIRRDKGKDVFLFYADIMHEDKILSEGDTVSFFVESAPKGPRAREVQKEG